MNMEWILLFITVVAICFIGFLVAILFSQKRRIAKGSDDERRQELVSVISHQLRTPLSITRGYLEALKSGDKGPLTHDQQEYLDEAFQITKNTIDLVNRFLDVLLVDKTMVQPQLSMVSLNELMKKTIKHFSILTSANNIDIESELPKKEIIIQTDASLLMSILDNIISNAIKYSLASGFITLKVVDQGTHVDISCTDTGVGIPDDQQKLVFQPFFRGRNIMHQSIAGSGLGLFIAKQFASLLHGSLSIATKEGKGTTVLIQLPKHQ